MQPTIPDYAGGSLLNLVAELEYRLTGESAAERLHPHLAASIPDADTYVLVLIDGLGAAQLDHPAARTMAEAKVATIDCPFPSTTTVSLSTVSQGRPASEHGLLGHLVWMPELGRPMNALKWIFEGGTPANLDSTHFLPAPNLWERLAEHGVESITVQPGQFRDTKLSAALYRGARYEGVWTHDEAIAATVELAAQPQRLIFTYMPDVDLAAHIAGQSSPMYADAMRTVGRAWDRISAGLPDGAVLVGTADHGHVDYGEHQKRLVSRSDLDGVEAYGDTRALFLRGDPDRCAAVAADLPGTWFPIDDIRHWWGPGPRHPEFDERAPAGVLLVDDGMLVIPGHMDRRLVGYHGGLADAERQIPLLVAGE